VRQKSFAIALASAAIGGLVARLCYVALVANDTGLGQDALWYTLVSGPLSQGKGYLAPGPYFSAGEAIATAGYPPLYPAFLALVTRIADGDHETFRIAGALAGTATVVLTGSLGRRLATPAVGIAAAALVAVFPSLLAVDGALMSETVSIPLLYAGVLAGMAAVERPSFARFALAGAVFGTMALARADAFVPGALVLGAAVVAARAERVQKLGFAGIAVLAAAVFVVPWVVRNNARVGEPTIATISSAATIAGANCDTTYRGRLIGMWDFDCMNAPRQFVLGEEQWSRETRDEGLRYAREHAGRVPLVVAVRQLRVLGLFHPLSQARFEAVEGRSYGWQIFAWICWLPVLVLGTVGLLVLARRDPRAWPLAAVALSVVATVAISYGNQRFRTAGEPAMLLGAAYAAAALGRRLRDVTDARAG
jgi:4-amino-4-deoxy-L-arabinose transferase-like glycosyltransferase